MENLKFILFSIIILTVIGFVGYWAFSTIESGSDHINNQAQKELEQRNENLEKEVTELKRQISLLESEKESQDIKEVEPVVTTPVTTPTVTLKYQSLIDELQKLTDGSVYLKIKSQGPAVGTVQKFLNIYNNTSNKVDNDYGVSTSTAVKNFQKAQGLTVDGETGPNTYKKMISWLKSK